MVFGMQLTLTVAWAVSDQDGFFSPYRVPIYPSPGIGLWDQMPPPDVFNARVSSNLEKTLEATVTRAITSIGSRFEEIRNAQN